MEILHFRSDLTIYIVVKSMQKILEYMCYAYTLFQAELVRTTLAAITNKAPNFSGFSQSTFF